MTDREKELIEAYIPSPRDHSLDWDEYFAKDCAGRVYKVHISGILPCGGLEGENHYSVYTDGGKRITDFTEDGNFPKRRLYDNKQDCRDETHNFYGNWERLRELQAEVSK